MVAKDGKKKKASADHPAYEVMILTAIKDLKNRKGSSKQAILKYIKANYKISGAPNVHTKVALRKALKKGKVDLVSGNGLAGRFKLTASAIAKKQKKKTPQKAKKSPKKAAKKTVTKAKRPSKKAAKKSPKKSSKKPTSPKKSSKKSPQKKQSAKQSTVKKQRKAKATTKKTKKPSPQKKKSKK